MNFEEALYGKDAKKDKKDISTSKLCSQLSKILKIKKASSWNQVIKDLIETFSEKDVIKVIEWLEKNYGKSYTRRISAIGGFRCFFDEIFKKMENDSGNTVISELSLKIAKTAQREYAWPAGTDRELPLVIQRSFDNYAAFRLKWNNLGVILGNNYGVNDRRFRLHNHITSRLSLPRAFIEYWIEFIGEKLSNWEGWNGSLTQYIWHPNHDLFLAEARTWTFDYCNSSERLDELWQLLEKE